MACVPPCIPCFFGVRNLGRVLATLPYFAFSVATFFPHSDGAKSLRFVGSSIRARWRDLRSNWIPYHHTTKIVRGLLYGCIATEQNRPKMETLYSQCRTHGRGTFGPILAAIFEICPFYVIWGSFFALGVPGNPI